MELLGGGGADLWSWPGRVLAVAPFRTFVQVTRTVERGEEFRFTFDLGEDWTHRCVVGEQKVDPHDLLGADPLMSAKGFLDLVTCEEIPAELTDPAEVGGGRRGCLVDVYFGSILPE